MLLSHLHLTHELEHVRRRRLDDEIEVYDPIRKKWIQWLPEEMVRQCWISLLLRSGFSSSCIAVEKGIRVADRTLRWDLCLYDQQAQPWMLIECKSPDISLCTQVIDQLAVYQSVLKAPYLLCSNGLNHTLYHWDAETDRVSRLQELPVPQRPSDKSS